MDRSLPFSPKFQSGFTLIEIMVVIVIIGIMTGMVALNVSTNDPSKQLFKEAKRFVATVSHAVNEASFQQQELGIVSTEDGYQFVRYEVKQPSNTEEDEDPTSDAGGVSPPNPATAVGVTPQNQQYHWVLVEGDQMLRTHEFGEEVRLILELEESEFVKVGEQTTVNGETEFTRTNLNLDDIGPKIEEETEYEPSVYVLSSGEMTPFVAEFFLTSDSEVAVVVRGDDLGRVNIDYGDEFE